MLTTLRRLLLVSAGAIALSASGLAQVGADLSATLSQAQADYDRADYDAALREYRLAADQGSALGQFKLGQMYARGEGVTEDDAEAVRWYRLAADQGNVSAQFAAGLMYYTGQGVSQNYPEAIRWFRMASAQGDENAQLGMGLAHEKGQGVAQSYPEAARWYRLAAEQGNVAAQFNLGNMYENGQGVAQSYPEAARWYRLAAEQGDADAQVMLGYFYHHGQGVAQSHTEAARWYRFAADQGNALAQVDLGARYYKGLGVTQNYVEAYKWWLLAAAQGDANAAKGRDLLASLMTPPQIAEGQRLAAAWQSVAASIAVSPKVADRGPALGRPVESTGTGFLVTTTGYLLTNAHVVEGCKQVTLAHGAELTVLDIDASSDLALLKADGGSTYAPLMIRQGRGVRLADNLIVAGYPLSGLLSSGLNVTTGAVSALAGPNDDRRLFQMTAPVQPGNSGGPVLDSSGNVVGVVVSKLDAVAVASINGDIPQNVNFAISLGTLQAFLDANAVDYGTRASTAAKSNADVAEIARVATVQIECRN